MEVIRVIYIGKEFSCRLLLILESVVDVIRLMDHSAPLNGRLTALKITVLDLMRLQWAKSFQDSILLNVKLLGLDGIKIGAWIRLNCQVGRLRIILRCLLIFLLT